MKHRYGSVSLTFYPATVTISAVVERTLDDVTWTPCGSFQTSVERTTNPDDVTSVLWARLQAFGDFDARETFIADTVNEWVAETVYNA